jgi:hypothetical protein
MPMKHRVRDVCDAVAGSSLEKCVLTWGTGSNVTNVIFRESATEKRIELGSRPDLDLEAVVS